MGTQNQTLFCSTYLYTAYIRKYPRRVCRELTRHISKQFNLKSSWFGASQVASRSLIRSYIATLTEIFIDSRSDYHIYAVSQSVGQPLSCAVSYSIESITHLISQCDMHSVNKLCQSVTALSYSVSQLVSHSALE